MHYYTFNIGDYRKDTGHLTTLEHGIYRQLLDWYYLNEKPIPKETQTVIRRLRLESESDIKSLQNVLDDFFVLQDDGYHQTHCDAEIDRYQGKKVTNTVNGKLGGRPKKTQSVILGNPTESDSKGNQQPITNNQEPFIDAAPKVAPKAKRLSPEWSLPKLWGEWTIDELGWTDGQVRAEADKFKDFWIAKAGKDGTKLDWSATWRNWCRNAKVQPEKQNGSLLTGGI